MHLFSSSNILLARGQFWGFDRLMMFDISKDSQALQSIQKNKRNKLLNLTASMETFDVASWGL
jgi:hypothetical protein